MSLETKKRSYYLRKHDDQVRLELSNSIIQPAGKDAARELGAVPETRVKFSDVAVVVPAEGGLRNSTDRRRH